MGIFDKKHIPNMQAGMIKDGKVEYRDFGIDVYKHPKPVKFIYTVISLIFIFFVCSAWGLVFLKAGINSYIISATIVVLASLMTSFAITHIENTIY